MGKTRDLFKKKFHAVMGMIKDRNSKDLTEAEDIRRDGKNTQYIEYRKTIQKWS